MTYFWPPRPESSCAPEALALFQSEGWWLQAKLNGTCSIFTVSKNGAYNGMGRHGADNPLVRWTATEHHKAALREPLTGDGTYVFVAELMHGRVKPKHLDHNPLFIHDILVNNDWDLTNTTYADRQQMLAELLPATHTTDTHHVHSHYLYRARNYVNEPFIDVYNDLLRKQAWFPEYEGVVIKRAKARLKPCTSQSANAGWQIKVRFPTDTATF